MLFVSFSDIVAVEAYCFLWLLLLFSLSKKRWMYFPCRTIMLFEKFARCWEQFEVNLVKNGHFLGCQMTLWQWLWWQGHDLKTDYKQPHTGRLGASHTLSFQEASVGTTYSSSSVASSFPTHSPVIKYREIQPRDLDVLKELHQELFPVRWVYFLFFC